MAEGRVQRRLAAILADDVVGYSRLIEADEALTRARLRALFSHARCQVWRLIPIGDPPQGIERMSLGNSDLNLYPPRWHLGVPETLGRIHSIHVKRSMTWQRTSNEKP